MNISEQMSNFEQVFENLDVKTADITGILDSVTGSSVQTEDVNVLLQQMMAEQGLEVGVGMQGAAKGQVGVRQAQTDNDVGEMQRKLDALRNI